MVIKNYVINNKDNEPIQADFRYDLGTKSVPLVIVLHGFKGFKDWGFFPDLCTRLTESDYATLCFNFSRNGIGLDPMEFTEADKFAANTCSHEIEDFKTVINAIDKDIIGKNIIDKEKMAVIGHSRGGALALLGALEMPDRFQAVVTWSSVSHLDRFGNEEIAQWKKDGYIGIKNSRTGQIMKLNKTYYDDLQKNKTKFDLSSRLKKLDIDTLFIHGLNDTTVPAKESEDLYNWCGASHKRLELIEDADHTFNVRHPFSGISEKYDLACTLTENWLDNTFLL